MSYWPRASQIVLRWSFALLFAWFGLQQVLHPADWIGFLPEWTGYMPIPGEMLVRLNGWVEFVCCIALFVGCYTRLVAAFLAVHLIGIAIDRYSNHGWRGDWGTRCGFSCYGNRFGAVST